MNICSYFGTYIPSVITSCREMLIAVKLIYKDMAKCFVLFPINFHNSLWFESAQTSGQSYKASTIIIYDSRVVPDLKIPHIMNLDS